MIDPNPPVNERVECCQNCYFWRVLIGRRNSRLGHCADAEREHGDSFTSPGWTCERFQDVGKPEDKR